MSNNEKKDINNLKDFSDWVEEVFDWVDPRLKRFMRRAWCARGKYDRAKKN